MSREGGQPDRAKARGVGRQHLQVRYIRDAAGSGHRRMSGRIILVVCLDDQPTNRTTDYFGTWCRGMSLVPSHCYCDAALEVE